MGSSSHRYEGLRPAIANPPAQSSVAVMGYPLSPIRILESPMSRVDTFKLTMEYHHVDDESVLKMDHSITTWSLKEVLKRQRQAQMMCDAKHWQKAFALQNYIDQEMEIHVGIAKARKKLHDKFKEYTAQLNKQIMNNRKNIEPSMAKDDLASLRSKSSEIEVDLNRRSSEISELQRDIRTAEQDTNSRAQWNNIDTVFEAKFAIKYIFKQLIDTKRILQTKIEDHNTRYDDIKQSYEKLKEENEKIKKELAATTEQYDMKLSKAAKQRDVDVSIIEIQRKRNDSLEDKNKNLVTELKKVIDQISSFSKMADNIAIAAMNTLDNEHIEERRNEELRVEEDRSCGENSIKRAQGKKVKGSRRDKRNASVEIPAKNINNYKDINGNIIKDKTSEWKATPFLINSKEQNMSKTGSSTTITEISLSDVTTSLVLSKINLSLKVNSKHSTSKLSDTTTSTQSVASGTVCTCRGSCLPSTCRCLLSGLGCGASCFCPCINNKGRQIKNNRCHMF